MTIDLEVLVHTRGAYSNVHPGLRRALQIRTGNLCSQVYACARNLRNLAPMGLPFVALAC